MLARISQPERSSFIKREIEKKTEHAREREREKKNEGVSRNNDVDDTKDNVERLLTKIEVVVMTGIGRDEALREGRVDSRRLLEKDFGGQDFGVLCVRVHAHRDEREEGRTMTVGNGRKSGERT